MLGTDIILLLFYYLLVLDFCVHFWVQKQEPQRKVVYFSYKLLTDSFYNF